ncbi:MAG TPA: response regulator [Candidatus Limnocylindrales bacterium]|nr:response regulator [Candidatus Limnocylindrales bacterium]
MSDITVQPINILIADDDEDDLFFATKALKESRLQNNVFCVYDGVELMDFLHKRGSFTEATAPTPDLILLDLNMPKKNGREALKEIRADENLNQIPIVILTTSEAEQDIVASYKLGANSYIKKPVDFEGLVELMRVLKTYWVQFVKLPPNDSKRDIG